MSFDPDQQLEWLESELRGARAVTPELMSTVMVNSCVRFPGLGPAAKAQLGRLIVAEAWVDAALALLKLELPYWLVRRLVREDDEWLCTLSRQPALPLEFDVVAEARHQLLPVAILLALLQARGAFRGAAAGMNPASQDAASDAAPDFAANLASRTSSGHPVLQELAVVTSLCVMAALVLICASLFVPPIWSAVVEVLAVAPKRSGMQRPQDRGGSRRLLRRTQHPVSATSGQRRQCARNSTVFRTAQRVNQPAYAFGSAR